MPAVTLQPGERELTVSASQTSRLDSEYGNVSYLEWCELEARRFRASGRYARVYRNDGKICCLIGAGCEMQMGD